jgi:lysylphosphatidylglycerol synthetase-like protein (DUF2156 family)
VAARVWLVRFKCPSLAGGFHFCRTGNRRGHRLSHRTSAIQVRRRHWRSALRANDVEALCSAFHAFCDANGWSIVYISTTKEFGAYARRQGLGVIRYGTERLVSVESFLKRDAYSRHLREKLRRAERDGVVLERYRGAVSPNEALERTLDDVAREWAASRHGLQVYLAPIELFRARELREWFYAVHQGQVVGVLAAIHFKRCRGYAFEHVLVLRDAPAGTSELLIVRAVESLARDGHAWASFGAQVDASLGDFAGISNTAAWGSTAHFSGARQNH